MVQGGSQSPIASFFSTTTISPRTSPIQAAMPFQLRRIFSKKARAQPLPPSPSPSLASLEAPVIHPYPQGSSPTSSCSTLVGNAAIERKDLTTLKCLSIEHAHDAWLVSHKHTGMLYTLHVYQLQLLSDEQRDLVQNGREMTTILSQSGYFLNIVSQWSDMGETCILTDYHPSTVQDSLTEQPLSKREAQLYAAHMTSALSLLHNMRAAHHDVKLSNVHLTPAGRPLLGGLGKISTASPMDGALKDIRDLGVCMYQMATGAMPFDEEGNFIPFRNEESVHPDLQLLIVELLTNQITDLECLKYHPYFEGIDWEELPSPSSDIQKSDTASVFPAHECDGKLADLEKPDTLVTVFAESPSVDSLSSVMSCLSYPGSPITTPRWEVEEVVWRHALGFSTAGISR
ncbi:Serine/threonine-protein kinase MRCK gamma [Pleurotus pulmonarius]|nr:Serine/threonine-protein kinase MRCK gamma [Pleurotus pulmonarius]KAF4605722.1 Serine/threonine-protein kinase MRCK gamma [Pleurotus pulmonarius]